MHDTSQYYLMRPATLATKTIISMATRTLSATLLKTRTANALLCRLQAQDYKNISVNDGRRQ